MEKPKTKRGFRRYNLRGENSRPATYTMRVDDTNSIGIPASQTGKAQESREAGRPGETRPSSVQWTPGGDKVELSDLAGSLARALSTGAEQRAQGMARLAELYADGRYETNARALARTLVAEAKAGAHDGPPGA